MSGQGDSVKICRFLAPLAWGLTVLLGASVAVAADPPFDAKPDQVKLSVQPGESCEAYRHRIETLRLPGASDALRFNASVGCAPKSLTITVSIPKQNAEGAGWLAAFADTELCASPPIRAMMADRWTIRQEYRAGPSTVTTKILSCDDIDRMLTDKNPPPAGTPEAIAAGIPTPAEPRSREVLDFRIGELSAETKQRSSPSLFKSTYPLVMTDDKVDVIFRFGERTLRLERVGGTGQSVLLVNEDMEGRHRIGSVSFIDQDRPLNLHEAVVRAKALEQWLGESGFRDHPFEKGLLERRFSIRKQEVDGAVHDVSDWTKVEALLANDRVNIAEIHLFTMQASGVGVSVDLKNWRRQAQMFSCDTGSKCHAGDRFGGQSIFDGNGGYEWGLEVWIIESDDLAPSVPTKN